jgi:hypothetical protein
MSNGTTICAIYVEEGQPTTAHLLGCPVAVELGQKGVRPVAVRQKKDLPNEPNVTVHDCPTEEI